jgi:hypothetical protein
VQDLGAVGEERGISLSKVKSPLVQFYKRSNQIRRCAALVDREPVGGREEITVGEIREGLKTRCHFAESPTTPSMKVRRGSERSSPRLLRLVLEHKQSILVWIELDISRLLFDRERHRGPDRYTRGVFIAADRDHGLQLVAAVFSFDHIPCDFSLLWIVAIGRKPFADNVADV